MINNRERGKCNYYVGRTSPKIKRIPKNRTSVLIPSMKKRRNRFQIFQDDHFFVRPQSLGIHISIDIVLSPFRCSREVLRMSLSSHSVVPLLGHRMLDPGYIGMPIYRHRVSDRVVKIHWNITTDISNLKILISIVPIYARFSVSSRRSGPPSPVLNVISLRP